MRSFRLLFSLAATLIAFAAVIAFASGSTAQDKGYLIPPRLQPRTIAALASTCWKTPDHLTRGVAVELAEAQGYVKAYNDNHAQLGDASVTVGEVVLNAETLQRFTVVSKTSSGVVLRDTSGVTDTYPPEALVVTSRDVGLWQISIPASQVGTQTEKDLYVPANNVAAACALWHARGFQPWVAYTTKVYLHDTYIDRALIGVMNWEGAKLVADAKAANQTPLTRVPFVSIPELRKLYPKVNLG